MTADPTPRPDHPTGVLFVCLGNICRSPLAEGLFLHLARERGVADRFFVDSCGTGAWHVGKRADPRSLAVAQKFGVELPSIARQFDPAADPARFAHIIAMDRSNRDDLLALGVPADQITLMLSHHASPPGDDVPDPYYGGNDGFDRVYDMLHGACGGLLDRLTR